MKIYRIFKQIDLKGKIKESSGKTNIKSFMFYQAKKWKKLLNPGLNTAMGRLFCFIVSFYAFNSFAETAPPKPNAFEQLFPFLLLGLVFYFLLIRPQQKKHKLHGDFLSKIKRGEEVLTSSGIYGRIEGLTDSFVILEVAENVRIRIAKSQIASYTNEMDKKTEPKKPQK